MNTTEERLAYIRSEIEQDLDDSEKCIQSEFDDNQVALSADHQTVSAKAYSSVSDESATVLEIEEMMNSRNRNNYIYQVDYEKPAESSTSVGGALKNWFKQKIRRLIAPVVAPLIMDQNTFNASVTTSINALSDNECKIAEFIKMQEEENKKLQKEMEELKLEVNRLREENAAARIEIIRARKRLHREMKLVVEEIGKNNQR